MNVVHLLWKLLRNWKIIVRCESGRPVWFKAVIDFDTTVMKYVGTSQKNIAKKQRMFNTRNFRLKNLEVVFCISPSIEKDRKKSPHGLWIRLSAVNVNVDYFNYVLSLWEVYWL